MFLATGNRKRLKSGVPPILEETVMEEPASNHEFAAGLRVTNQTYF
jgi:hypothetical protein